MISLECKQSRKALHFYQLRFHFAFFIFANSKIKDNELGMGIFTRYFQIIRNTTVCELFKVWSGDNINNIFTCTQHFIFKFLVDENGSFCIPEIKCTRMQSLVLVHVGLVFFFCKIFIELFS